MRTRAFLAAAALLSIAPAVVRAADPVPSLNLRNFRAPIDPASGVFVQPAEAPATGEWNVGLFFSYAYRPITLRDAKTNDVAVKVLSHQITTDVVASIGFWNRLQIGFDLPVLLFQSGDTPSAVSTRALGDYTVPGQAFGDLGLVAKGTLVRPTAGDLGGFALALDERFTVPTGDPKSFLGEGVVTSETRLLGEYRFPMIGIHGVLGFKARGHQVDFACNAVGAAACTSRFGHELPFGLGVTFIPKAIGIDEQGRMTWYLEMHGQLPVAPQAPFSSTAATSLRLDAAARFAVGGDVSILAGVQTALLAGVGDAPFKGMLSVSWAPRTHDKDGDGVPDDADLCPDLPEDRDGFQDADGCPDTDNDGDGVPDREDRCPNTKEDQDGYQDTDGCPDPDNDQDKILDAEDACPNEAGAPNPDPKKNGCPVHDKDGDGIADDTDACPDAAGPANANPQIHGCPSDHDADGDGIPDIDDACPKVKGVRSAIAKENGCPDLDPDKDTFLGDADKCPNEAETWNGFQDDDGCPDEAPRKARPLLVLKEKKDALPTVEIASPLRFTAANEVEAASQSTLRALAAELGKHPEWSVRVGVRISPKEGEAVAEARAKAIVAALRKHTRNEKAAEITPWNDVKAAPRAAEHGIGFVLVGPIAATDKQAPAAPRPAAPKPAKKK
ncbi:internalin, putative [Minicystis rosea]|nr:internalin, putative [Minicystis rosea]